MNRVERLEKALEVARGFVMNLACREHLEEDWSTASATLMEMDGVLNPPPAYEDVEVVRYAVFDAFGTFVCTTAEEPTNVGDGGTSVKLTGTRKRPLPAPVEKTAHGTATASGIVMDGEAPAPGTRCVVMWEEGDTVSAPLKTKTVSAKARISTLYEGGAIDDTLPNGTFKSFPECHGKTGILTFTWEDQ